MIIQGHALEELKKLPDKSVHCCITSPPYFNTRAYSSNKIIWGGEDDCEHNWKEYIRYGISGGRKSPMNKTGDNDNFQIIPNEEQKYCLKCGAWYGSLGREPIIGMYVNNLVTIFREIYRVLRNDGVFFLNVGDSYVHGKNTNTDIFDYVYFHCLKDKELYGIPWLLADTLRRPFLKCKDCGSDNLTISGAFGGSTRCNYCSGIDFTIEMPGWLLRQDIILSKKSPMREGTKDRFLRSHEYVFMFLKNNKGYYFDYFSVLKPFIENRKNSFCNIGSRLGDVWHLSNTTRGKHGSVFPKRLVELLLLSGCPDVVCKSCGTGYKNKIEPIRRNDGQYDYKFCGSIKNCKCATNATMSGIVIDPFAGVGTVGVVAKKYGMDYILIDLSEEYCQKMRNKLGSK